MRKTAQDRFAALAADIASPGIIAKIDAALEENARERSELLLFRKMAVVRHGDPNANAKPEPEEERPEPKEEKAAPPNEQNGALQTVSDLIRAYKTDPQSRYHTKRYRSRANADGLCRTIETDIGSRRLAEIKADDLSSFHKRWIERSALSGRGDGTAAAFSGLTQLRTLINYGAAREDRECIRLSYLVRTMGIKVPEVQGQGETLTLDHVKAIMREAHKRGYHSMALAQALQFETPLRQTDVIGEWVPINEPGESDIKNHFREQHQFRKWMRGIRWEHMKDGILHHVTSWKGRERLIPLGDCQLVQEEFARIGTLPSKGPIILNEETNLPYGGAAFRAKWRRVARAAGVPESVKNMDSSKPAAEASKEEGSFTPGSSTPAGWGTKWTDNDN